MLANHGQRPVVPQALERLTMSSISGILPRNGKKITFAQFEVAIMKAFNLAPTVAVQLTAKARYLDNGRGYIDLYDLNAHNVRLSKGRVNPAEGSPCTGRRA